MGMLWWPNLIHAYLLTIQPENTFPDWAWDVLPWLTLRLIIPWPGSPGSCRTLWWPTITWAFLGLLTWPMTTSTLTLPGNTTLYLLAVRALAEPFDDQPWPDQPLAYLDLTYDDLYLDSTWETTVYLLAVWGLAGPRPVLAPRHIIALQNNAHILRSEADFLNYFVRPWKQSASSNVCSLLIVDY